MPEPSWRASAGRLLGHIAAAAAFVVVAVGWSFPLARHLSTHLPGPSAGDNFNFLWNFWWMRTSLASGLDFFHTTYVFVPTGTDLTLHTHTALPAFLGATVLGAAPVIAALNLTILGGLFLNGFCTYLLAWRVTRDQGAAVVGGIVFGGSPYIAAHLNGHFNLTMAWTIPLFAITISEAIRGSAGWAVLAGLVFGVTAYIDYYYVVYEAALGLCIVALTARKWSVAPRRPSRVAHRLAKVACFLILVDIAVIATIVITGGFNAKIGPIQISAHELFNPLQALWLLVALFIWLRLRLRVDVQRRETCPPRRVGRAVMIMAAVFSAVAAPLVWNGVGLLIRGEYVSQRICGGARRRDWISRHLFWGTRSTVCGVRVCSAFITRWGSGSSIRPAGSGSRRSCSRHERCDDT